MLRHNSSSATIARNGEGEDQCCWICLGSDGDLFHLCACPQDRVVHKKCLARWQLQSAGQSEEHRCRFCHAVYPDWKESLTPRYNKLLAPVVAVNYNGTVFRIRVQPGSKGLAQFQAQLRKITGSDLDGLAVSFSCKAPDATGDLHLHGMNAFDAAIHCAAISASERTYNPAGAGLTRSAFDSVRRLSTGLGGAPQAEDGQWSIPADRRCSPGALAQFARPAVPYPTMKADDPFLLSTTEYLRQVLAEGCLSEHPFAVGVELEHQNSSQGILGAQVSMQATSSCQNQLGKHPKRSSSMSRLTSLTASSPSAGGASTLEPCLSRHSVDSHQLQRIDTHLVILDQQEERHAARRGKSPRHQLRHQYAQRLRRVKNFFHGIFH